MQPPVPERGTESAQALVLQLGCPSCVGRDCPSQFEVRSAGPDGTPNTLDDVVHPTEAERDSTK